jgi:dihydrofolate reductase
MAYNLEEALDVARKEAANAGVDEIMVIGGDDVFRAVMPLAKRIYLTEVHAQPHADTWFKDFNLKDWRELSREKHEPGPKDQYPFSFVLLERP